MYTEINTEKKKLIGVFVAIDTIYIHIYMNTYIRIETHVHEMNTYTNYLNTYTSNKHRYESHTYMNYTHV